jgi:hypothetical protein
LCNDAGVQEDWCLAPLIQLATSGTMRIRSAVVSDIQSDAAAYVTFLPV